MRDQQLALKLHALWRPYYPPGTVTPWLDDKSCKGLQHQDDGGKRRCGCQVKFSYRAYGMAPARG